MAEQVTVEIRGDHVAVVRLDDKTSKFNTLSRQAIRQLDEAFAGLEGRTDVQAVVLAGKPGAGLGAGANIGELMAGPDANLREMIQAGHRMLNRIEDFRVPVVALIGNLALGGILELGLAPQARVADQGGQLGFPEINLLLFPGLYGAPRTVRRIGLGDASKPEVPGALSMILTGKPISAEAAHAAGLVDELVPAGADGVEIAAKLALDLAQGRRQPRPEVRPSPAEIAAAVDAARPVVRRANKGRNRPKSGTVFLDLLGEELGLPREEAQKLEADEFCRVTLGPEGKAGMRFFFVNTAAGRPPRALKDAKPVPVKSVGIAGTDGYMGNAITYLALANAKVEVVGWTVESAPNLKAKAEDRLASARRGLLSKYAPLVKKGSLTEEAASQAVSRVRFTSSLEELARCDLVIEAIIEDPDIKLAFFEALARHVRPGTIVASNSSSMGPGFLSQGYEKGGGRAQDFLNLHFFSPAELPAMALTEEFIASEQTSPEATVTAFNLARSMKKTPVLFKDGSRGFFVNACLASFMSAAEELLTEGTPVETLDEALTAAGMPQGYASLMDAVGLDTCAGMMRFMGRPSPLLDGLVKAGRLGKKTGAGFYDYDGSGPRANTAGVYSRLGQLMPGRGNHTASDAEIVERCFGAMYEKARELLDQGIVDSKESADLAMILGLGFPVYLGGIFHYAGQRGWDRS